MTSRSRSTARHWTRRQFLATASAGAAIMSTKAAVVRGSPGANEAISIGCIGVGGRGTGHLREIRQFSERLNARITAVCDVYRPNLKQAADYVAAQFGSPPRQFTRYQDLLALKDLDAVTIATPDFSHGLILVAALKAGKDVYCEKPMCIQPDLANQALDLATAGGRIVQAGTQHRSRPILQGVARAVAAQELGKISRVDCAVHFNHARWDRDCGQCRAEDVDWDAYLMDLPKRPFDPKLLLRWQLHHEFTNGLPGLWMTHYVDTVHLMMNCGYPAAATALGGTFVWKDGRETADTFQALLTYPEEFLLSWGMSLGNEAGSRFGIYGRMGAVEADEGNFFGDKWTISPKGGDRDSKVQARAIEPVPMPHHMENWLDCIRTRKPPAADITKGHQHSVACIMVANAQQTGRRQSYDPAARTITAA